MRELPTLVYVRHGETEWSLSGQHTSRTDLPLTEQGEAQARELGPWLARLGPTSVISSPRRRALQTCELAIGAQAPEVEPDAAEWDYGEYEGLRTKEIQALRPGWSLFRDGCPGGESPQEMSARVDRVIERLRQREGTLVLFSHGHFGAVLAARWLRLSIVEAAAFPISPASLSLLGDAPGRKATPALLLWNASPRLLLGTS